MSLHSLPVHGDPEILGGTPVVRGTRVPSASRRVGGSRLD